MSEELRLHLKNHIHRLTGAWVARNANYELDICRVLSMELDQERYWDASWERLQIEFKKGKSVWLDLVRYSEVILRSNELAKRPTINLFFVPGGLRNNIVEIIAVDTSSIIRKLGIDESSAETLITLKSLVPRSLNAQASLTLKDLRKLADFRVLA